MAFSNNLKTNTVHEWKDFYVDYDKLHSKLKHRDFKKMLTEEMEKVNNFYFLLEKKAVDEKDNIFYDVLEGLPQKEFEDIMRQSEDTNILKAKGKVRLRRSRKSSANKDFDSCETEYNKDRESVNGKETKFKSIGAEDDSLIVKDFSRKNENSNQPRSKDDLSINKKSIQNDEGFENVGNEDAYKSFKKKLLSNGIVSGSSFEKRKKEKNLTGFILSLVKITQYRDLNATAMLKLARKYSDMRRGNRFYHRFSSKLKDAYFYKSKRIETVKTAVKQLYRRVFARNEPEKAKTVFRRIKQGMESSDWLFILSGIFMGIAYTVALANQKIRTSSAFWASSNIYLGFLLFGFCLKIFKDTQINYKFIFNFDVCSSMNNSLYLITVSSLLLINTFLFYFLEKFEYLKWAGIFIAAQLAILFIPANILFFSSRLYLLSVFGRIVFQPFSTIRFRHFYFADIAQSFSYCTKNILVVAGVSNIYIQFFCGSFFTVIRIIQCLKRYSISKLVFPHVFNSVKFTLGIVYGISKIIAKSYPEFYNVSIMIGVANSVIGLFWDVFIDWIIKRNRYMYPLLLYPFFVLFDIFARFYWLIRTMESELPESSESVVEICRRFMWTLVRVEVEHLNNCNELKTKNAINLTAGELFYKKNQTKIDQSAAMNDDKSASIDASTNENEKKDDDSMMDVSTLGESLLENESISGFNSEIDMQEYGKFQEENSSNCEGNKNRDFDDYLDDLSEFEEYKYDQSIKEPRNHSYTYNESDNCDNEGKD